MISMIEFEMVEAFALAHENEEIRMSARDMISVLRNLDYSGWQLTRKPEPIVDPVPAQPPEPVEAMVIKPEPRPEWLPIKIMGLWGMTATGHIMALTLKSDIEVWKRDGLVIVEADSLVDAKRVFNILPSTTVEYFELDGKTYEYRSDMIPF